MPKLKTLTTALTLALLPTFSTASDYVEIYTQPMEGVYSQGWFTSHIREAYAGKHEIYVRGEGKMGDFFGVLWLDCEQPKYSNWLTTGGYLSQQAVPIKAINAIRKRYC